MISVGNITQNQFPGNDKNLLRLQNASHLSFQFRLSDIRCFIQAMREAKQTGHAGQYHLSLFRSNICEWLVCLHDKISVLYTYSLTSSL